MTILTRAELLAARKLRVGFTKTGLSGSGTLPARSTLFDHAGNPPPGTLAGTSTNGVIPTDATTGCPDIPSFGGLTGYLTKMDWASNNAGRAYWVFDLLWKAGTFGFGTSTPVTAAALTRLPGGDYKGLEVHIEITTTFVGNGVVTLNYDDESGNPQTATINLVSAVDARRIQRVPLPTAGIQRITNVSEAGATAGAFNVVILRRLTSFLNPLFLPPSNAIGIVQPTMNYLHTGFPQVYEDSALYFVADTTNGSRAVGIDLEISVG
jgi:hypothetical protein